LEKGEKMYIQPFKALKVDVFDLKFLFFAILTNVL